MYSIVPRPCDARRRGLAPHGVRAVQPVAQLLVDGDAKRRRRSPGGARCTKCARRTSRPSRKTAVGWPSRSTARPARSAPRLSPSGRPAAWRLPSVRVPAGQLRLPVAGFVRPAPLGLLLPQARQVLRSDGVGRAVRAYPAVVDPDRPLAQLLHGSEIVRDEDDGRALALNLVDAPDAAVLERLVARPPALRRPAGSPAGMRWRPRTRAASTCPKSSFGSARR